MLLIYKINEKLTQFNFVLDLESAIYKKNERTLYFVFRYSDSLMLKAEIKNLVNQIISEELGAGALFSVKYRKNSDQSCCCS